MLQVTAIPSASPATVSQPAPTGNRTVCERLQRLEPAAWKQYYTDHRRLVRGVMAGFLGYGSELDDAVQQAFETALDLVGRNKVRLSGEASGLRAWLVAIALRVARTEARRRKRSRITEPFSDVAQVGSQTIDPEGRQILMSAMAVLQELPERERIPWLLRRLEHLTLEEVASSIGVSLATVKRRLQVAERKFQKLAQRDCVLREHLNRGGHHD
jgi:RNA polymerase sigma-70 factor, ECF subfamily